MPVDTAHLFSDSACCLYWITSTRRHSVFVENRLKEIRAANFNFHYVPSEENPADLLSRGTSTIEIQQSTLWWYGPPWVREKPEEWPKHTVPEITPDKLKDLEQKMLEKQDLKIHVGAAVEAPKGFSDFEKFSSFSEALYTAVYVLRGIKRFFWSKWSEEFKGKLGISHPEWFGLMKFVLSSLTTTGLPTANDLKLASMWCIYQVQREHYPEVFKDIEQGNTSQMIRQLGLRKDQHGILRC